MTCRQAPHGADVNAKDREGRTVLMLAAGSEYSSIDTIRLLIDRGADVHAKSAGGETALDFARRGGQAQVVDTIIFAIEGSDTAFFGYSDRSRISSLLLSDGLEAGEARAWVRFPRRSDSVTVGGIVHSYKTDSVVFTVNLVARDTLVHGLKLIAHRVPLTWDTTTTFAEVDAALHPDAIIDSVAIPDTLKTGAIRLVITDSTTMANLIPADDSGQIALGFRLRGDEPTGVRLGAIAGASGAAGFSTYVRADSIADTTSQKQTLTLSAEANFFVRNNDIETADPDLLYAGGVPSYRSILRFELPPIIKDTDVRLIRATLELTPAEPITGLRGDAAAIDAVGVTKDIGAKSSASQTAAGSGRLPEETSSAVLAVDLRTVVERWRGPTGLPSTVFIGLAPEGGSFYLPVFLSTRAALGRPRLRLTYMQPSPVERP